MGLWRGTQRGNGFVGTPTSGLLGIHDPTVGRTMHVAGPTFLPSETALPQFEEEMGLTLDEGESVVFEGADGDLTTSVWGDFEGAAKLTTIRSGDIEDPKAFSTLWTARDALVDVTTERMVWITGPAATHPMAVADKRVRRFLTKEVPHAFAVGHLRFGWVRRMRIGTTRAGVPFALADAKDQCLIDSPRPVRVVVRFAEEDRSAMHALARSWSDFVGVDLDARLNSWSDVDRPANVLKLTNKSATAAH